MLSRDNPWPEWFSDESRAAFRSLAPDGETPFDAYSRIARAALRYSPRAPQGLADDVFTVLANGWLGPASPVLANFGTDRGLPVSCYLQQVQDSVSGIFTATKEAALLSKSGGGLGIDFGRIRPTGARINDGSANGRSGGVIPWMRLLDLTAEIVSQGGVRKGSAAMYLPSDHPDLPAVLRARDHTTGSPDQWVRSNIGITITDAWMEAMLAGDQQKRGVFTEILKTRLKTGSPYLVFTDAVNRANPDGYKALGLEVTQSNLCSEITLATSPSVTQVCVLSSLNVAEYSQWKDWRGQTHMTVPEVAIWLLDAVTQEFIDQTDGDPDFANARRGASKGRPLGLGVAGFHTFLQQQNLPIESEVAAHVNRSLFREIKRLALVASRRIAVKYGRPEYCRATTQAHSHLLAIAPTKTNSAILGCSEGINPIDSNAGVYKQSYGIFERTNPVLAEVLAEYGPSADHPDTWESIYQHQGSVQHLDWMENRHKVIFRTAREVDQYKLLDLAASRQAYICQGQSLNLFVQDDISATELAKLHVAAWKKGTKGCYYLRSTSPSTRAKNPTCGGETCSVCEG